MLLNQKKKDLEKAIYGSNKDENKSLAQEFGNINTLDIQINDRHGSMVQYFDHLQLPIESSESDLPKRFDREKNEFTNEKDIKDLIRFSSILGLRDLHEENLVYSNNDGRKPQLIDAEIAMWFVDEKEDNPLRHVLDYGEASKAIADYQNIKFDDEKPENVNKYVQFLENAKTKLKSKKSRVVLIDTGALYKFRTIAYFNKFNKKTSVNALTYTQSLKNRLKDRMKKDVNLVCDEENLIEETKKLFLKGEIPYFEYDFDSGKIYQKITETNHIDIYQSESLKLDNVIRRRKRILKIAYLKQEEKKEKDKIEDLYIFRYDNIEEGIGLYDLVSMNISELERTLIPLTGEIKKEIMLANLEQSEEQTKDEIAHLKKLKEEKLLL